MRTSSSICNDFKYFVRSTTGQLIFVFGNLAHHVHYATKQMKVLMKVKSEL
jgi:hypothetical protein